MRLEVRTWLFEVCDGEVVGEGRVFRRGARRRGGGGRGRGRATANPAVDELISLSLELHRSSSTVEKGQENEEELDCLEKRRR